MIQRTANSKRQTALILALDVDSYTRAKHFVDLLYPKIKIFKVGSMLFTACGPKIIEYIRKKKAEVFLDLKFLDIPNTVANSVAVAGRHQVKMFTLHISGGKQMLVAAVEKAKKESRRLKLKRPLLIGVTVLTSQPAEPREILKLAKLGLECGLDGVVCSSQEIKLLRENIPRKFIIVTPGIRPKSAPADDQKRTATASEAIKAGSDFLVVGRPILEAKDPLAVTAELLKE